jgi:hypothetical protein
MLTTFLCAAMLTVLLPGVSQATLVIRRNILELTHKSSRIVEGKVAGIDITKNAVNMVCTRITIEVTETIKGNESAVLSFLVPGGKVDANNQFHIAGMPKFKVSDEVVLFLEGDDNLVLTGLGQGRFTVDGEGEGKLAIQNTKGLCMLDAKKAHKGEQGGPVTDWPEKYSSHVIRQTSQLKAGVDTGASCGHIQGAVIRIPYATFKTTVKECLLLEKQ